ncbi:MAG: phosphatase PAP2 family protein [Clostridia bacterium]|nr:phosphatase PAP2 family protein [Clostridia bacterium]
MAQWLNTAFSGLDGGVFSAMNAIQCKFLNVFCKFYSYIGEKGLGFILAALILCCFAKTRRIGATALFAIAVGALFTNVILKGAIARPRPYTTTDFNGFWAQAGANLESEFSFPSGHTTASTAFCVALLLSCNKKIGIPMLLVALVMGFCRIYLIVHYFTDVIAGFIVGSLGAVIAKFLVKFIYDFMQKREDKKFFYFLLNKDLWWLLTKKNKNG